MKKIINSLYFRFIIAGSLGAGVNLFIFHLLFSVLMFHYLFASMVAVGVSLMVSFLLQKFFTFKNKEINNLSSQVGGYLSVAGFNLAANVAIVFFLVEWLNTFELLAQGLAAAILAVSSFIFYRFFIFGNTSMKKYNLINQAAFLVLAAVIAIFLVFSVNGVYDLRIDSEIYLGQIDSFSKNQLFESSSGVLLRLAKPVYGFVGAIFSTIMLPQQSLLLINICFFFILIASFFWLLLLLGFNQRFSLIGCIWLIFSYPLLKYGLALGTDISGWALAAMSVALILSAIKSAKDYRFLVASLVGTVGLLSKETGVMGLLFGVVIIVFYFKKQGLRQTLKRLSLLLVPAGLITGSYFMILAGRAPLFLDWFKQNQSVYQNDYHTFVNFVLVESSSFNILWLLVVVSLVFAFKFWKKGIYYPIMFWQYMLILSVVTLPVLLWPIFISRIIFIQFLWVIPVALLGLSEIEKIAIRNNRQELFWIIAALPVLCSVILFVISQGGSLYDIFL
ncbi:MAG: GtrA family protein [Candidatus Vogelbacteria bacterium]|nr:GtrA family protein [Candidatus Vogelbacteria bacterium]